MPNILFSDEINFEKEIVKYIENSTDSIFLMMFKLDYLPIITSLRRASKRGVRVNILLDIKCRKEKITIAEGKITNDCVEDFLGRFFRDSLIFFSKKDSIMHHKIILIDRKEAIFMSANLTHTDLHKNINHLIVYNNPEIINSIEKEYKRLTKNNSVFIKEENSEIKYSLDNNLKKILKREIITAKKNIDIAHSHISDDIFLKIFQEKIKNGIQIRILTNPSNPLVLKKLKNIGCSVKTLSNKNLEKIHTKMIIIDSKKVLFGSVNLFERSLTKDIEHLVISVTNDILREVKLKFEELWFSSKFVSFTNCQFLKLFFKKGYKKLIRIVK